MRSVSGLSLLPWWGTVLAQIISRHWVHGSLWISTGRVAEMNRKGFTLIELLIVGVIIGILAAIAIPKFANTKEKAYLASMKSDLRNLVTAEEAYFADSVKDTSPVGAVGVLYATTRGGVGPALTVPPDGGSVTA